MDCLNGEIKLLNRLIVSSPSGPCYVNRNYRMSQNDVDSQLLSAIVSIGSSGGVKLSKITRILRNETLSGPNSSIEIVSTHNYISCAISSDYSDRQRIREVLPKVNQMTYEVLGDPEKISSIKGKKIGSVENKIDLLLTNEGLLRK